MAGLLLGLVLAPEKFWMPLPSDARLRTADWLRRINAFPPADSNWLFLRVLTNFALRHVGVAVPNALLLYGQTTKCGKARRLLIRRKGSSCAHATTQTARVMNLTLMEDFRAVARLSSVTKAAADRL